MLDEALSPFEEIPQQWVCDGFHKALAVRHGSGGFLQIAGLCGYDRQIPVDVDGQSHVGLRIDKRDGRCVVITIDPVTGERNPDILRAAAAERQGCLGVYGSTVEPGRVTVNDSVLMEPAARPE